MRMTFYSELQRRKVLRTGATYILGALGAWAAVELGAEAFSLPSSALRYTIIASIVGLPVALIAAWFLELRIGKNPGGEPTSTPRVVLAALGLGTAGALVAFTVLSTTLGASRDASGAERGVPGFGARGAIAVLPFTDISPEGGQQHLGDGIADAVLTRLQRLGSFPVISRLSSFLYRDGTVDLPTVAAELGVRYILEASLQVVGDAVRVNARLVDAENDTYLWSRDFREDRGTVFDLIDKISEEIVAEIAPEVTRTEMRRTARARPQDLDAWELTLSAQYLILTDGSYDALIEAREFANRALAQEPGYAPAYVRLAQVGHDLSLNHSAQIGNAATEAEHAEALDFAREAARGAPSLVEARIFYGHLLHHHGYVALGLVELREAVALDPSNAQARAYLGFGLAIDGDFDGALREAARAVALSRTDPRNTTIRSFHALVHLYAGDNEAAISVARSLITAQPEAPSTLVPYVVEISALVREDRLEEALESAREFRMYHVLDSVGFARGAWSQAELDHVFADLRTVGLLGG